MKGIYLTEEGKQEIESKIAELEEENKFPIDKWEEGKNQGKIYILEEILSSATIKKTMNSWKLNGIAGHLTRQAIISKLNIPFTEIYKHIKSIDEKGILETHDGKKYKIIMAEYEKEDMDI